MLVTFTDIKSGINLTTTQKCIPLHSRGRLPADYKFGITWLENVPKKCKKSMRCCILQYDHTVWEHKYSKLAEHLQQYLPAPQTSQIMAPPLALKL